ncbi:hypothetical protein P171DRAFT_435469 [Karstenula rhodostoma CBS 690.94]|uniref:C2H2-type domain-containing protein n=1 Tax=Karstenula rhodostoma CBS 690.94 TaxID=1392251 RepID=A0A9P4P950_9PLEO|nr:hypothetical protein P171DRAFT_435469 [Karstenula rhodostoma CBS 690.94]
MAAKRKVADSRDAPLSKKTRTETGSSESTDASDVEDDPSVGFNASTDRKVNYTDSGKKRADSEAKRSWNYVCDFEGCGQRFNRPCRLDSHMRTHTKERPFACPHEGCDRDFPRKDHLQRHLTHFHAVPERRFVCDWEGCGKTFTSNGRLQRHKEVHDSKFYCTGYPPCKEIFRKQKTLDAHIKTVHLETKAYPCTFVDDSGTLCTHGYQTENGLRRHMASAHSEKEEPRHFCMLCPSPGTDCETIVSVNGETASVPKEPLSFSTAAELQAHHTDIHPPTCPTCGQVFSNQSNLNSHLKAVHTSQEEQQLFQCPHQECGKMFNRRGNLNAHVSQVHENQYRFACTAEAMQQSKHPDLSGWNGENACGKLSKTKAALEQHIRTHHLGLPNRKVTRKAAKARQRLIPEPSALTLLTGVGYDDGRPITCLVNDCPSRFARDRDLKRHVKAEHNYTDAECEAAILERGAARGEQFWIGGLDDFDPTSMSGSTEPSMPQTPMPYFGDQAMDTDVQGGFGNIDEAPLDPLLMDLNMIGFESMDVDMNGVATEGDGHKDFQDFLTSVQQYNDQMQG